MQKSWLLILIAISYSSLCWGPPPTISVGVPEVDYSKELLKAYLQSIHKNPSPNLVNYCESISNYINVLNCGAQETNIRHAVVTAMLMTKNIKSGVEHQLKTRKRGGEIKILQNVKKVLNCMEDQMTSEYYISCSSCSGGVSSVAQTKPRSKDIEICPDYFKFQNPYDRAQIIVHEISHLCGTKDDRSLGIIDEKPDRSLKIVEMKRPIRKTHSYTFFGWEIYNYDELSTHKNADNFAYWSRFGFCMPGECNPKKSAKGRK